MAGSHRSKQIEKERRLRQVQEWILQDYCSADIVKSCVTAYNISERQAKRYLADARDRWTEEEDQKLDFKRAVRINALKKLLRNIDPKVANSPAGIRAQLAVHDRLILLDGVRPTKQMIEAEIAKNAGKAADPLAPTETKLEIVALMPYAQNQAVNTTNP